MSIDRRTPGIAIGLVIASATCFGVWQITAARSPDPAIAKPPSAASVKPVKEDELATIILTEEAQHRLGIRAAPVEQKRVTRSRTYGGDVMAPLGRTILVAAPVGGTIQAVGELRPQPGQTVTKGQRLFSLLPLLSPEASTTLLASRAEVDGQVKSAETQLAATKLALERADRLYRQEAGSKRTVEEAQAQYDLAQRTLDATQARLAVLTKALGDAATGQSTTIAIESPVTGILRSLSVLPGQNVPAGGALFEIVGLAEVWVRVPVYVGDLDSIDSTKSAAVGALNMRAGAKTWQGRHIPAPPSANSLAATVDLYYVVDNESAKLRPGQRVGANLPLIEGGDALTIPWSAVVHDIYGGTWVYTVAGERTYKRQRVVVKHVPDRDAVLASGPTRGTQVVVEGAIELFGAETGFSK